MAICIGKELKFIRHFQLKTLWSVQRLLLTKCHSTFWPCLIKNNFFSQITFFLNLIIQIRFFYLSQTVFRFNGEIHSFEKICKCGLNGFSNFWSWKIRNSSLIESHLQYTPVKPKNKKKKKMGNFFFLPEIYCMPNKILSFYILGILRLEYV